MSDDDRYLNAGYVRWFAWYPMRTEIGWAWLREIERKRVPFGWFIREPRTVSSLPPEKP